MNKHVALTIAAAAIAFGASACSQKYVEFPVYEGPGVEPGVAKRDLVLGAGGYFTELHKLLEANQVDAAIALVESQENKDHFAWYELSVLYSVKHDWAKAEDAIQKALDEHGKKGGSTWAQGERQQSFVQEYKRKFQL